MHTMPIYSKKGSQYEKNKKGEAFTSFGRIFKLAHYLERFADYHGAVSLYGR
jgi:hypothetical protein